MPASTRGSASARSPAASASAGSGSRGSWIITRRIWSPRLPPAGSGHALALQSQPRAGARHRRDPHRHRAVQRRRAHLAAPDGLGERDRQIDQDGAAVALEPGMRLDPKSRPPHRRAVRRDGPGSPRPASLSRAPSSVAGGTLSAMLCPDFRVSRTVPPFAASMKGTGTR